MNNTHWFLPSFFAVFLLLQNLSQAAEVKREILGPLHLVQLTVSPNLSKCDLKKDQGDWWGCSYKILLGERYTNGLDLFVEKAELRLSFRFNNGPLEGSNPYQLEVQIRDFDGFSDPLEEKKRVEQILSNLGGQQVLVRRVESTEPPIHELEEKDLGPLGVGEAPFPTDRTYEPGSEGEGGSWRDRVWYELPSGRFYLEFLDLLSGKRQDGVQFTTEEAELDTYNKKARVLGGAWCGRDMCGAKSYEEMAQKMTDAGKKLKSLTLRFIEPDLHKALHDESRLYMERISILFPPRLRGCEPRQVFVSSPWTCDFDFALGDSKKFLPRNWMWRKEGRVESIVDTTSEGDQLKGVLQLRAYKCKTSEEALEKMLRAAEKLGHMVFLIQRIGKE